MTKLLPYLLFLSILCLILPHTLYASNAPYDEQLGLTFTSNFTAMAYNVTPVAQTDFSGYGPAYLLNGYTNAGYWVQVGVSWNWQELFGYSPNQFQASYEVFSPNGTSIFPTSGGAGLINMPIPINEGDKILLSLYFNTTDVIMYVKDWNTGASAWAWYPKNGATEFVGNPSSTATAGFFTGLMTEWYHAQAWYQNEQAVTYSPYGQVPDRAWLWSDEFYCPDYPSCNNRQVLFFNQTQYPVVPYQSYYFTAYNATEEFTSSGDFVTGATPPQKFNVIAYPTKTFQTDYDLQTSLNNSVGIGVTGGVPPYSYALYIDSKPYVIGGPLGGGIWTNSTTEEINVTKVINYYLSRGYVWSIGPHYYNITISDSNGNVGSSPETLLFIVNPDPRISLNIQKTTIDVGQVVSTAYNITGGTAPFKVSYFVNNKYVGNTLTIPDAGNYSVYVRLTDGDGFVVNSSQINFVVNQRPNVNISYSKTSTDANTPLNLVVDGSGGTPPYNYSWYVNKQQVSNSNTYAFSENQAGTYIVYASLRDAAGDVINSSQVTFTVNAKPSISTFKVIPTSSSFFDVNNGASGAVNIASGTPPYSYAWYVNGVLQPNSNSSSYIFESLKIGANNVSVTAIDVNGNAVRDSFIVETSYNYLTLGGIVVLVAVIGVVVYLLLYNKRVKPVKEKKLVSKGSEQEYLNVLKRRYAKGEITKKQYDKLRKDLE